MRLLNVRSLALEEFHGNPPPYAILSHTWEAGEVLFQDLQPSAHRNLTEKKLGYQKIRMSCNLAREDDIPYIWIDTCCINKESSAELSEAINSMFRYYRNSIVCYAHLFDVRRGSTSSLNFYKCKWFTRGWTLQELLAPSNVIFLDMDWVELGTKHSLQDFIAAGTGIPTRALVDFDGESFSVAQMMSWASQRRTTREEDQAYCLMGIFGVHMPALYGEGAVNAFTRLQLEIIKRSYDQSIFVWSMPVGSSEPRGLLARSPSEFRASGKIRVADGDTGNSVASTANEKTFSMTNNGLRINLPLEVVPGEDDIFLAFLDCHPGEDDNLLGIYLQKTNEHQQYVRCRADEVVLCSSWSALQATLLWREVFVRENQSISQQNSPGNVRYQIKSPTHKQLALLSRYSFSTKFETLLHHPQAEIVSTPILVPEQDLEALKLHHVPSKRTFLVIIGVIKNRCFLDLVMDTGDESIQNILQSYNDGSRSSIRTRALDRVTKVLHGTDTAIRVGIRKTRGDLHHLDLNIVPASSPDFANRMVSSQPTCGLMIRTFGTLESGLELEEVIMVKGSSREDFENSVTYLTFKDEEPIVIFVFERYSSGRGFQEIAVILGIHLNRAWTDVVHVTSSIFDEGETIERILRSYYKEERSQWQESVTRIVESGESKISVEVTTGVNQKLQLGTHWAAIKFTLSRNPAYQDLEEHRPIPRTSLTRRDDILIE